MQRSNTYLLAAVGVGIAIMTVWRLCAAELPGPPGGGGPGGAAAPAPGGPVAPPPDAPPDAPRVVVDVVAREVYAPPLASRVQAVLLPQRTPLPTTMLAGTGANPWADAVEAGRAGAALVLIEVDGGHLVRHAGVHAAAVTELGLGAALTVRGTVRDERRGPVVGARVWLGELDGDGAPREIATGEDGTFEGAVRAGVGVPLMVRADGFADAWQEVEVAVDGARDFTVTLTAGGTLDVQLAGQAVEVERGQVFVAPGAARSSEVSRYPFFLQAAFGGAALDASGRATLRGLPQHGELEVVIVHPQAPLGDPTAVRMQGERGQCLVPVRFAAGFDGRVVDGAGAAIAGALLLLRPGGRPVRAGSGLMLQPPWLAARGCLFAETGPDGAFRLGTTAEPGGVLSVRAPGHAGRDLPLPAGGRPDGPIVLPAWVGGALELRVEPPAADRVWRCHVGIAGGVDLVCAAGEPAVVALPHAGAFDLRVATWVGEEKRGERELPGVPATGPVVLAAPSVE